MGRIRTTLDKPTRAESVTRALRDLIVGGELKPRERLQEQMLAERLGVSRTPVHESLKTLAAEGLVVYEPHCGFMVRELDASDVVHAFDVRMVLEGHAARVVAERGLDDETATVLERNLARSEQVLHGARWNDRLQAEWFTLNWQFHDAILARAANPYLARAVNQVRHLPKIYDQALGWHLRADLVRLYRREQSQQALADHRAVFQALASRQPERAEFLLRDHIFCNREAMLRNFEQRVKAQRAE